MHGQSNNIWCGGGAYYELENELPKDIEIIAYADSNEAKSTALTGETFRGKRILSQEEVICEQYDYILICTYYYNAWTITRDLCFLGVDRSKIQYLYRRYYDGSWESYIDDEGNVIHNVDGLTIRERKDNQSDFQVISELLCTNCYGMNFVEKEMVVIDMGMNIGMASIIFAAYDNVCKVYSYEPFKDTYEAALYNLSLNMDIRHKIEPYNIAVYNSNEQREMAMIEESAIHRSTEYENNNINASDCNVRKEIIEYRKASEIVYGIVKDNPGKTLVAKIDVEGAEFEIFQDLEKTKMLDRFDIIMMEYHRNSKYLMECLNRFGFHYFQNGNKNVGMLYATKECA